jgi:myosin heavy subunit
MADAEETREVERLACVKLQAWWRMMGTIRRIERMQMAARMLQRNTKAALAKIAYRKKIIERLQERRRKAYHNGAVLMQSLWRGYWSRKTIHDYYGRWIPYMDKIKDDSVKVTAALAEFRAKEEGRLASEKRAAINRKHALKVSREHHLLGTTMITGVYDSQRTAGPVSEQELRASVKDLHLTRAPAMHLTRFGQQLSQWDGYQPGSSKPTTLRPIQGPFKSPDEVARIKNLQPMLSLRAQTDFRSLERSTDFDKEQDWHKRVNPGFQPFNQTTKPFNPYQGRLMNATQFADTLDVRLMQSLAPQSGDLSCRIPTKTTAQLFQSRFDATVVGVDNFDSEAMYTRK